MTKQAARLLRLTRREELHTGLGEDREWDVVIVGGGVTGPGFLPIAPKESA